MAAQGESEGHDPKVTESSKTKTLSQQGDTPVGSKGSKESGSHKGVSTSKAGAGGSSPAKPGAQGNVNPGTQAKGSEKAERRYTEEEKGKKKAVDQTTPMEVERSKSHTSVEEECAHRDPTGLNTMWVGPPDEEGAMEMRTEIICRPSEGPHRPKIDPARDNRGQMALFRGRQFTELHFEQADRVDMEVLRGCSMEFAHISGSRHPPIGYDVQDILTLYAYRPEVSPVLRHNRLGARLLVFKVLSGKRDQ